tara:strand:+ start:555 stop:1121 length:567 start_codon:yes stop_codon:yes gene_type:complete
MKTLIKTQLKEHIESFKLASSLLSPIEDAAKLCIDCIKNGGKLLLIGNGGSAADAQHIAAELVGRYKIDRDAIPAIALTTDSSILTSISNDYGFEQVFERQIEALANDNDVVIGISTSGKSNNIINAINLANKKGCNSICLTGGNGGLLKEICNVSIIAPSHETARIQEIHIFVGHTICHLIEQEMAK